MHDAAFGKENNEFECEYALLVTFKEAAVDAAIESGIMTRADLDASRFNPFPDEIEEAEIDEPHLSIPI